MQTLEGSLLGVNIKTNTVSQLAPALCGWWAGPQYSEPRVKRQRHSSHHCPSRSVVDDR